MNIMKHWMIAGGMAFLLLSCVAVTSADGEGVAQAISGEVNTVKKGSRFEIRVTGNPTTGYCWVVENQSSLKHVKLVSETQELREKRTDMVGGPARPFVFTFDAVSPGKEKIVMVYKRVWEKKAPLETSEFQINITE